MMRVYHSVFAAAVRSVVIVQDCLDEKHERLRLLFSGRVTVDRRIAKALGLVLVVSLLATVGPFARHTIAGLASKSRVSVASWGSTSDPTKVFSSLADRYGSYGMWRSAHAKGKPAQTGNEVSLSKPANAEPMPLVPMPPDAPPTFTDDPLEVGATFVKALHINQLRDAVNLVRARVGLPAASWELPVDTGWTIKAAHIVELRTKLDDARFALGLPAASYSLPAPSVGGQIRAAHVQELRDSVVETFNTTTNASAAVARLDPANQTGGRGANPLSRNYNWSIPLVSLAGRGGLDLGLSLTYNSLVWTKRGSSISFDDDRSFPSPGFRLGFPVIQPPHFNSQVGKWAYLLITPSGGRVELRQVGTSNVYESADSSYLQLTDAGVLTLLTTDGTRLNFSLMSGQYRCTQIKDRNGNYLTVAYHGDGRLDKITDTLGRTITFNYDTNLNLISITQPWKRQTEANPTGVDEVHTWATFSYTNRTLQPLFSSLTVIGQQPGTVIPVIERVGVSDGSYYKLDYNQWMQVWKVTHFAADSVVGGVPQDTHALSHTRLNLPGSDLLAATPQTDCPRFTEERTWVEKGVMNQSAEVTTSYSPWTPNLASCEVTVPDGTIHKELYATSGWQKGLTTQSEVWSAGQRKKWTTLTWEHDGAVDAQFMTNPRVTDTTVNDSNDNHRRTSFTFTSFGLPQEVTQYAPNTTTPLRTMRTEYDVPNLSEYHSRRIIGLPNFQYLYEGTSASGTLVSKVGFVYDDTTLPEGYLNALPSAATQHDATNYGTGLRWRGNANRVRRYDVTGGAGTYVESQASYNITGTVAFSKDAGGHKISVNYADSFYQGVNRSNPVLPTFAYPTTVTDPDLFTSSTWYNYDMGVVTESETPLPNEVTDQEGPKVTRLYDSAGRAIQVTNSFNAARTKWVYPSSMTLVQTFTLLDVDVEPDLEAYSASYLDGAGRVRASLRELPGSVGGYSGQFFDYDSMGRLARQSNPTETTAVGAWPATGDDESAGWLYTQQTYDWNGRPLVTTNTDGTTKTASYAGCGCAGGEVITLTDEGTIDAGIAKRRQQKVYSDVLGRTVKTETLNWEGGSVYATVLNTYNARDQLTLVRQYQGTEGSGVFQDTTMSYDGHGRLQTKHVPEQKPDSNNPASTNHSTWLYNDDDTLKKLTDARGAVTDYTYNNNRGLATGIAYTLLPGVPTTGPSAVVPASGVTYGYDAARNRTSMTDGLGSVSYNYNQLSRLNSEMRTFNDPNNPQINGVTKTLSYNYNLVGQLKSINDPSNLTINYGYDNAGRISSIGSASTQYVSSPTYRASGAIKHLSFGNGRALDLQYNARLEVSRYEVPGVMGATFNYYADGRVQFENNLYDVRFHRKNNYDHVGRHTLSLTGNEAAGLPVNPHDPTPYRTEFGYDAFGHATFASRRHYHELYDYVTSYTDERNNDPAWQFDAHGNATKQDAQSLTYDAANHQRRLHDSSWRPNYSPNVTGKTITQDYDGDGRRVKMTDNNFTIYYLRSSPLGGAVLTETRANGLKMKTNVYMNGSVVAEDGTFRWVHWNPSGSSRTETGNGGDPLPRREYDPMGAQVEVVNPYFEGGTTRWPEESDARGLSNCGIEGIGGLQCQRVIGMVNMGLATPCPHNICGPQNINGQWYSLTFDVGLRYRRWVKDRPDNRRPPNSPGAIVINVEGEASGHWEYRNVPQNTFDFQRIHDLLRQTVTKAPCATFIRRILKSVSSAGNPLVEGGDLEKLFFNVLNQKEGGFTRDRIPGGGPYGSADGRIKANGRGNAVIFLSEFPDASLRNWSDAQGAISELIHLAGKNLYYDYDLALAVNAIPEYASEFRGSAKTNPFDPSYEGNAKDKYSLGYSSFFHGVQNRICVVPKED